MLRGRSEAGQAQPGGPANLFRKKENNMALTDNYLKTVYQDLLKRNPEQKEFHQTVYEFLSSVEPVVAQRPELARYSIIERMLEPEQVFMFPVSWMDDQGKTHVNHGLRLQYNTAIGPAKGGLRFHPSVNLSIIKFLGFEMVFKNSLTGLPLGGAKGGADFDPRGKSDDEVMRFCQAFMDALYAHIGPDTDIPAGDIGVGAREIGYLFGHYKKLTRDFSGVMTGKAIPSGGSLARKEATGYGICYFAEEMLEDHGQSLFGKRILISGSGNVAIYANEKASQMGATVVAMSDSDGYIVDEKGIDVALIKQIKEQERARIRVYADRVPGAVYHEGSSGIWSVPCDVAFPCATQNELDLSGAEALHYGGCFAVVEGANMPTTPEAVRYLQQEGILVAPSKAANAGGVSVSCLEMTQNAQHLSWSFEEVDARLKVIMQSIYRHVADAAKAYGLEGDYVRGANIAAFTKVADAMLSQGL